MNQLARYSKSHRLDYFSTPNLLQPNVSISPTGYGTAAAGTSASYGALPNKPETWDGHRIYGCVADEYGYYPNQNHNAGVSTASTSDANAGSHDINHNISSFIGISNNLITCKILLLYHEIYKTIF